jgi:hypothetical protein
VLVMPLNINTRSGDVIGRFSLKVGVSGILAAFDSYPFCLAMGKWISVYAFVTLCFALLRRETFERDTFTRWDEALWLLATGLLLTGIHKGLTNAL